MIKETSIFSLDSHEGAYKQWPTHTRLYSEGKYTGTKLPGYVIERQYEVNDCYILILSMDCMFEESNYICLLNSDYKILSKYKIPDIISPMPGSYNLNKCEIKNKNTLILQFNEDLFYELNVNLKSKNRFLSKIFNSALKLTHITSHCS